MVEQNEPKSYHAVMVSSTFRDLEQHRQCLIEAIHRQDLKSNVMEHVGARADSDVVQSSLAMVRDAAAYIGVTSHRYGQVPEDQECNPTGLSITELEFGEAARLGRPILLFIMGERHPVLQADVEV